MAQAPSTSETKEQFNARRDEWVRRVNALADQLAEWAAAEGWACERHEREITEKSYGAFLVPELVMKIGDGEVAVIPVGVNIAGRFGRVDVEAVPTLNRVSLLPDNGAWQIWTDSNIPLRVPWDRAHFVQVAHDLLA